MNEIDFLKHPIVLDTLAGIKSNKLLKDQAEYNLFSISSSYVYLERFHSDVIASLLDPYGKHNEKGKFLDLFISFLNAKYGLSIKADEFNSAKTFTEIGNIDSHIDILIEGEKECIIIENKINNAPDMGKQIDRYYSLELNKGRLATGIVYLSLDGVKQAPIPTNKDARLVTRSLAAFTSLDNDLVLGWLQPCWLACKEDNHDAKSLIYQYIKLVKHLANKKMDTVLLEEFYQFVSPVENLENAKSILKLYSQIPEYRANKFISEIGDHSPFVDYVGNFKTGVKIFQNFHDIPTGNNFRMVFTFENINKIEIVFHAYGKPNKDGLNALTEKLSAIGMNYDFVEKDNSYYKEFKVNDPYASLLEMDRSAVDFVKKMLQKLRPNG